MKKDVEDVLNLSVVNFKPMWGDKDGNIRRMKGFVRTAVKQGSNMIVFPEMAMTGYDNEKDVPKPEKMQTKEAETIPGPATEVFSEQAKENDIYIIFGMPERDSKDPTIVYNSAAICCPDGRVLGYRKIHLPNDESDWATSGDTPMTFETEWGLVGLGICYDSYNFPELMRYTRAKGARLFINCTACAKGVVHYPDIRQEMEGNAIMNCTVVANANLCGFDNYNYFIGGSSVMVPSNKGGAVNYLAGQPFYSDGSDEEDVYTATVDLTLTEQNKTSLDMFTHNSRLGRPDFRPDVYSKIYAELKNDPHWSSLSD